MQRGADRDQDVVVDRVACTAHGVCSVLSEGAIELGEFGYPIQSSVTMSREAARQLAQACPARALLLSRAH